MIYIDIMGHGTVGSGVAELLINHEKMINQKIRNEIKIKYILDLREFKNLEYSSLFTKNFDDILNDKDVKIVAEVMGGINPAYDYVKKCLENGKSVVTSNKELVAEKGAELLKIAEENNVNFLFEASVGGGIPILRPMAQCLAANSINTVTGILNGTTNYILNKMIMDNMDFESALKLAQDKGFAERNPAADIEGGDACRKICILASLAFGKHIYPKQVKTEGIKEITLKDVEFAEAFGYSVKLICTAKDNHNGKVSASVRPTFVSKDNILSSVNGVFNAITVNADCTGDVMFYGKGAGKMPTASAVCADIIDCAKHLNAKKYLYWEDGFDGYVEERDFENQFYIYAFSSDFDLLLKSFEEEFPETKQVIKNKYNGEIAFITNKDFESKIRSKINKLNAEKIKVMPILH